KGITHVATVPSAAARSGTLCSAPDTTPACTPTPIPGGVDPSAQKYLPFWGLPNGGLVSGTNGDIGIFAFPAQQVVNENFFTSRGDIKISAKDSLTATYLRDVAPYSAPDSLNDVGITSKTVRHFATLAESHIFSPTLLNSARIGFNRYAVLNNESLTAINPLAKDLSLGAIPGRYASQIKAGGITSFTGGVAGNSFGVFNWNSFQEFDDVLWTHGTHSLKFGGGVERMQENEYSPSDPSGIYSCAALRDFLTTRPSKCNAGLTRNQPTYGYRQPIIGLHTQADWQARSNLTV